MPTLSPRGYGISPDTIGNILLEMQNVVDGAFSDGYVTALREIQDWVESQEQRRTTVGSEMVKNYIQEKLHPVNEIGN